MSFTQTQQTTRPSRRYLYGTALTASVKSDRSDTRYHCGADLETGETFCTCPGFQLAKIERRQLRNLNSREVIL